MAELKDLFERQRKFQEMVGDLGLQDDDARIRIGQLVLLGAGQANAMLHELGYETHKPDRQVNWDNALHEWVDQFKYLLAQAVVAGWKPEDIEAIFSQKSRVLEERWIREHGDPDPRPIAVFDLDGVIAHYGWHMTMEEMAAGSLVKVPTIAGAYDTLWYCREQGLRIFIVTSRKVEQARQIELDTELWLHDHAVPYDRLMFAYDKSGAVSGMNVAFAVEDSEKHALDYAKARIPVFFFRSMASGSVPEQPNIKAVDSHIQLRARIAELMADLAEVR